MSTSAEWYYVGHYGQLGPLTMEQMEELVQDGVVSRETYIWKAGMEDWSKASAVAQFASSFPTGSSFEEPPPFELSKQEPRFPSSVGVSALAFESAYLPVSDKNRLLAGILQLIVPGVGRMYLGYAAIGVLQLALTPLGCLTGWLWSIIDGIYILTGGVKLDGYGRRLPE